MKICKLIPKLVFLLLLFPFIAKAQGGQSTTLNFGVVTVVPTVSCAIFGVYTGFATENFMDVRYQPGTSPPFTVSGESNPIYPDSVPEVCVTFSPSSPGQYSGSIYVDYDQGIYNVAVNAEYALPGFVNPKYVIVGVEYNPPGT